MTPSLNPCARRSGKSGRKSVSFGDLTDRSFNDDDDDDDDDDGGDR